MPSESYTATPRRAPQEKPLWGQVIAGVKAIIKWTVIALVAIAAYSFAASFLGGFPDGTLANSIGQFMDVLPGQIGTALSSAATAVGSWFSGLAAQMGMSTTTATLSGGALAGTTAFVAAKTHTLSSVVPDPTLTAPTHHSTPDISQLLPDDVNQLTGKAAHSELAAQKTVTHVAADKTHEALEHRAKSRAELAARHLLAKEHANKAWVDRVDVSRSLDGPKIG